METRTETITPTGLTIEHTRAGYSLYCTLGDRDLFVTSSPDVDLILRFTRDCFIEGITYTATQTERN